jgi:glycosyltransferase involved in cell wall biosynthesis
LSGTETEEREVNVPRFSVIITFHNQRQFIKDAMDSALSQAHTNCEIIVVDDASSDGSPEILQEYRERVRLLCLEKNVGACAARNNGAAAARGEYLVFLDGDDAFLPWALEVYAQVVAAKHPKVILGTMRWFEGTMQDLQAGAAPAEISFVEYGDYLRRDRGYGHSASAMVIMREVFEEAHGWLVGFFPLEDVELAMRLGTAGRTVQILEPKTIWHRAHGGNSVNNVLSFMPAMRELLRRERDGVYPGGAGRRLERRGLIGGIAVHWIKRALKSGLRIEAVKLGARSAEMIAAGMARRVAVKLHGERPVEKLPM